MRRKGASGAVSAAGDKWRLFVEHYLRGLGPSEAAKAAGYKDGPGLKVTASKLLRKPEVRALIEERVQNEIVTSNEVLEGILGIARNPEAKDSDKLRGWELLGKHLALFTEKQDVTLTGEVATRVILPEDDDGDG